MSFMDYLLIASLCLALMGAEILNGIFRTVWLSRRIGKEPALKLSVVTGLSLAFVLCFIFVPIIALKGFSQHFVLGIFLMLFMASFDILFGKLVMRFPWQRIARDFDPRSGNYLSVGLVFLTLIPALVWWLRGMP